MKGFILFAVLWLYTTTSVIATHIVGGEFEIIHTSGYNYLFRQIQYFDVVNGDPLAEDIQVTAYIFRKRDNALMGSVTMTQVSKDLVPYTNPACTNSRLVTRKIVYSANMYLDPSIYNDSYGYYMVWERCCRNGIITNIVAPEQTGQTFYIEFPPVVKNGEQFINSSPHLFPPLSDYACVGRLYYVDFRGVDPDGDSLVYKLVTPLNSHTSEALPVPSVRPHPNVLWADGISDTYQVPGDPTLQINSNGFLTVVPSEEGLFVFSVLCEEYRAGKKIGEVRRDFQLFVLDCPDPGNKPEIQVKMPDTGQYESTPDTIRLTQTGSRCLDFLVKDKDGGEKITMKAVPVNFEADIQDIFSVSGGSINYSDDTLDVQTCFPECPYLYKEPFIIDVIAMDNTCPLPLMDTLRLVVLLEPPPNESPLFTDPVSEQVTISYPEGNVFNIHISAEDADLDSLLLSVFGDGFDLADFGISVDTLIYENGFIDFNLDWDPDCEKYPLGEKNNFRLVLYVEDEDMCQFENKDSLILDVEIEMPSNNLPQVLLDGKPVSEEITLRIEEGISLSVVATDQDAGDTLILTGIGDMFDLDEYGISFENKDGVSPLTSNFSWNVPCDEDILQKDSFNIVFVVEDMDKCKVSNADSVELKIKVLPPQNEMPELTINDKEQIDTVYLIAGEGVDLEIAGFDADNDNIILVSLNDSLPGLAFEGQTGKGSINTQLQWFTDCSVLKKDFQAATYSLPLTLTDDQCLMPGADTVVINFVVHDRDVSYDFLPPNVFTPNYTDTLNQYFYIPDLPPDNCRRKFDKIIIFNRWGKQVFSSTQRDFKWDGDERPTGVYFYHIDFGDYSYKGTLTLLR